MNVVRNRPETSTRNHFGVVVELLGGLPPTLPNTLAKALSGAVITDEFLLLPVVSVQLRLLDGTVLSNADLRGWLLPLASGSIGIADWGTLMRGSLGGLG
jgi:hypothetical protein